MLKNNIKNKANFFSQYLGQMVSYPDTDEKILKHKLVAVGYEYLHVNYKRKIRGCVGDELSFTHNGTHNSNALNAKLILAPLSKLTDKDAIDLVPLVSANYSSRYTDDFIKDLIKKEVIDTDNLPAMFYDILRSKGYALPFMGLSVDDLVDYGWIAKF